MKLLCAILRRSFVLALLATVGMTVFLVVRHRPRCTIRGALLVHHLSADGTRLVTRASRATEWYGRPQVWDALTGALVHELPTKVENFGHGLRFSPDGRHAATLPGDGTLRLIDWQAGTERCLNGVGPWNYPEFSRRGSYLLAPLHLPEKPCVIDVHRGEIVLRPTAHVLCFNREEQAVLCERGNPTVVVLHDLPSGANLATVAVNARELTPSPGGTRLATCPNDGGRFDRPRTLAVWDLTTLKHCFSRRVAHTHLLHIVFSPDDRTLALWPLEDDLRGIEFLDASTGKRLSVCDTHQVVSGFCADGSLWYYWRVGDFIGVIEVASGRVLWERPNCGRPQSASAGRALLHQNQGEPLELLDVWSGKRRGSVPRGFATGDRVPFLTPDGRYFSIEGVQVRGHDLFFWERWLQGGWPDAFAKRRPGVMVMATASGRELLRVVPSSGWLAGQAQLSDDGSTLVTVTCDKLDTGQTTLQVWDVHPQRAWLWALAASAATWLALRVLTARQLKLNRGRP